METWRRNPCLVVKMQGVRDLRAKNNVYARRASKEMGRHVNVSIPQSAIKLSFSQGGIYVTSFVTVTFTKLLFEGIQPSVFTTSEKWNAFLTSEMGNTMIMSAEECGIITPKSKKTYSRSYKESVGHVFENQLSQTVSC